MQGRDFEKYLRALALQLKAVGSRRMELVVCGGAALGLLGLSDRPTRDIDVLGEIKSEPGARPRLVEPVDIALFEQAAGKVARDYGLPEDWINLGGVWQVGLGLPEGIEERVVSTDYGERLGVHLCSKQDLLCLKLFAANDARGHHVEDLEAMKPSEEEMKVAVEWCLEKSASTTNLKMLLEELGHEALAEEF